MATFQDFSLIKEKVDSLMKEGKLPTVGYAFAMEYLAHQLIDADDIEEWITDGANDQGIDAYYYDEENLRLDIFQFKYTSNYEKHTEEHVSQAEIDRIENSFKKIWNKDRDFLKAANRELQHAIRAIWNLFEKGQVRTTLHIVTNFTSPIKEERKKRINESFRNDYGAKVEFIGIEGVVERIIERRTHEIEADVQFSGKGYLDWTDGGIRSLVGVVSARTLLDAISEKGEINETIFDENVRLYLKKRGKINKQIFATASGDDSFKFFYFNNGITVICDRFHYNKTDSPVVKITNMQIVNGSQTVHALFDVADDPDLAKNLTSIYLLVRLYEVPSRQLGQDIATYTNSQNPVKGRDVLSNDPIQIILEEDLRTLGYFYSRKVNQFRDDPSADKDKIVDAEKLGQVLQAFYLGQPGAAKNKKKQIYESIYSQIFDPAILNAKYVLLPYLIYKEIEKDVEAAKKEKREYMAEEETGRLEKFFSGKGYLLHASYYILLAVRLLGEQENIDIEYSNLSKLKALIPGAEKMAKELAGPYAKDEEFSIGHFYKSDSYVQELRDKIHG